MEKNVQALLSCLRMVLLIISMMDASSSLMLILIDMTVFLRVGSDYAMMELPMLLFLQLLGRSSIVMLSTCSEMRLTLSTLLVKWPRKQSHH